MSSASQSRLYLAKYNDEDVVIREPTFEVTSDILCKWRSRVVTVASFMRAVQNFPPCFAHIYGGGVEYLDDDEDATTPETVQQLFIVLKYYPQGSLFSLLASPDWNVSDTERITGFVYRITLAAYLAYAVPEFNIEGMTSVPLLSPAAIVLNDSKEPVISCSHIFQHVNLTSAGTVFTEGSLHFESIPIQTLRWYSPEQLKTDQKSASSSSDTTSTSAIDVYTIGLLFCYMLTGALPYAALFSSSSPDGKGGSNGDISQTHSLLDAMRSGQQLPYIVSTVTTNPSLLHLLTLCLHANPKNRPSLMFVLTSLKTISVEINVALPFEVSDYNLPVSPLDQAAEDDSGSESGLVDFDDMTSQVENISSTVKLFRSASNVTDLSRVPSVVVFGGKIILLNFNQSKDQDSPARTICQEDDEEETEEALGNSVSMSKSGNVESKLRGNCGIIIFHIDNTTSMKRQQRNQMTKDVLLRVIPDMLRKNFRVIVNSWASDATTRGKIQTREISVVGEMLEPDRKSELVQHIQSVVAEILNPSGKTDLYGSIYQLLDQCEALSGGEEKEKETHKQIFCFVLTDGNHNHFAYPTHAPQCVGEDYFGVYSGQLIKKKLAFGLSGKAADIPTAEAFLARKFQLATCLDHMSLTLIGIGDAGTTPLSSLANALGEYCSFVGITEISQADCVFSNIDNFTGDVNGQLRVTFSHSSRTSGVRREGETGTGTGTGSGGEITAEFQYVLGAEDSSLVSGCVTILDAVKSDVVVNHSNTAVVGNAETTMTFVEEPLHFDDKSVVSEGSKYNRFSYSLEELVETVLPILTQIRSNSYDVTAETFQALFTQLLRDKKQLWIVKTALFAKKTRPFRQNPIFAAFAIWLKELEYLIDSQISSYRVNVEDELFANLESAATSAGSGGSVQPATIVLERLKNNVRFGFLFHFVMFCVRYIIFVFYKYYCVVMFI